MVQKRHNLVDKEQDDDDDDKDDDNESEFISADSEYSVVQRGSKYHSNYRAYIKDSDDVIVSPFHDIPLKRRMANVDLRQEVLDNSAIGARGINVMEKILHDSKRFILLLKVYNMVVEIPRWTNAKMEISLKKKMNPIIQDLNKNGHVRFTSNCFPFKGYIWNYGALPQTWENPDVADTKTGLKGDGDPIDIIEIGNKVYPIGSIVPVSMQCLDAICF